MADNIPPGYSIEQVGAAIRNAALTNMKPLGRLIERIEKEAKRGYLDGLDGRKIFIRSKHSALNAKIQSGGAIAMKIALCFAYNWIKQEGLDCLLVGNFHDEWQFDVAEKDADRVMELSVKAIVKASQFLKLNCPLDGDAHAGDNWSMTH